MSKAFCLEQGIPISYPESLKKVARVIDENQKRLDGELAYGTFGF